MIDAIYTPCRASDIKDIEIRLNLLKIIKGKFPIGFEIMGPISDFMNPDKRKKIIINSIRAKESGLDQLIIHSPV